MRLADQMAATLVTVVAMTSLAACDTAASTAGSPPSAGGTTIEVCADGCGFTDLVDALAAAADGDTVVLGGGTYDGGVDVLSSITLRGAGPDETVIEGGGPVITVGEFGATGDQPTVTIEALTLTGGVTRTTVEADEAGLPGAEALGGGLMIPAGYDGAPGATVTLRDVVISDNRVASTDFETFDDGVQTITASLSAGGGIANWGDLTLERTVVRDNLVGAASGLSNPGNASDADGGGIYHRQGDLTIIESEITGNVAAAVAPNGRYAEGGGIFVESGAVSITDTVIGNNTASLEAEFPATVETQAHPGGILLHGGVTSATFERTRIVDNVATVTSEGGFADATTGGINVVPGVDVTFIGGEISGNRVEATATDGGDASAAHGGGVVIGTVVDTVVAENVVAASSEDGDATAAVGGLTVLGTIDRSRIEANAVVADAPNGETIAFGGGLWVAEEPLTIKRTAIEDNTLTANGERGWVRGGGIYAGPDPGGFGPSALRLIGTVIRGNTADGGTLATSGGGLYVSGSLTSSAPPVHISRTRIVGNSPDDCDCPSLGPAR